MAGAQDIPINSPMGLDYFDYLDLSNGDPQLATILQAGEAEWMASKAAKDEYAEDLGEVWAENAVLLSAVLLSKEKSTQGMLDELTEYMPQTLRAFGYLPEDKYPLLHQFGRAQLLDDWKKTMEALGSLDPLN